MLVRSENDACNGNALNIGVDASRSRSGGAIAHVCGFLAGSDPRKHGIGSVHLWAHDTLFEAVPETEWLTKHRVSASRRSIFRQVAWQRWSLPKIASSLGLNAMFNTDAGSVYPGRPAATLSQDMLSFEPGEIDRYPWPSRARIRLELLRIIQIHRLQQSTAAIFLTEHARKTIDKLAVMPRATVIPHGIDSRFWSADTRPSRLNLAGPIRCLYVSNAAPYKHQWHVVDAIASLRRRTGLDFRLRLVGGGHGKAMARLNDAIATHDPNREFVDSAAFVPNESIVDELAEADIFVFASSCENLPVTLLEAMAAGLPIASSDRGPMIEVLGPDADYFDPEKPESIAAAIEGLAIDPSAREKSISNAKLRAKPFTWARCADETWQLLALIAKEEVR